MIELKGKICGIGFLFSTVFLLLGLYACKLELYDITGPDQVETYAIITLNFSGRSIASSSDNSTAYGLALQIPSNWEVLEAKATAHSIMNIAYWLQEDPSLEPLFSPEPGYKVWVGTCYDQREAGVSLTGQVKLAIGAISGESASFVIKAIVGAVRNGAWQSDDPEGVTDFAQINGDTKYAYPVIVLSAPEPIIVDFSAYPTHGNAILPVLFHADAYDPDGKTIYYYWDFDGDRNIDQVTANGTAYHNYIFPGSYQACVMVSKDASSSSVAISNPIPITVTTSNNMPIIDDFNAHPSMGPSPLPVEFSCVAHDPNGDALNYLWDFNGDLLPEEATSDPSTVHVFYEPGIYQAYVIVSDDASPSNEALTLASTTDASPSGLVVGGPVTITVTTEPPVIESFTATPTIGSIPLRVTFECQSYDPDGDGLRYLWDFDGNGIVDKISDNGTIQKTYEVPGNYSAYVVVADDASPSAFIVSNPVSITCSIQGDLNSDGNVDGLDLYMLIANGVTDDEVEKFASNFGK